MSAEQLDRFLAVLEAKYLDEKTREIDESLKKELAVAVKNYQEKEKENDKNFLIKIRGLKSQLEQAGGI